jgi:hypothetical protein
MLWRIPAGGERQRDGEGGTGDAEGEGEQEDFAVAADAEEPSGGKGQDHHHLHGDADAAWLELVHQEAVGHAQEGAREHGHGDHEAELSRLQMQGMPDLHAQRPEQHPDHEGHVEIEEGTEQGRQMTDIAETRLHVYEAPGGRTALGPSLARALNRIGVSPFPDQTTLLLCTEADGRFPAPHTGQKASTVPRHLADS